VFDGAPSKHNLNDEEYASRFAAADARYTRMLSALLSSLKQPQTDVTVAGARAE